MQRFSILLILFVPLSVVGQNAWFVKDTVNGSPRSSASAVILNNEAYIIAGLDEDGFRRRMHSYSFTQDDWDLEESMGGENGDGLNRGSAVAFTIGLKSYVTTGQGETNAFFKDTWEYDLVTQTWSQKADFLGEARRQAVAFVIGNIAYVGTGLSATGLKKDMFSYSASTNTWTQLNDFAGVARKEAAAFSMGDQAYIGTGDGGAKLNDFWEYQQATDSWVQKASMPGLARKGAVGWGIFPNGYICAGEDSNFAYSNELWEYNFFLNSWTQRPSIPGPGRSNAVAFVLNGFGFVGTGYNGVFLNDLFAFKPTLGVEDLLNSNDVATYPIPASEQCMIEVENNDLEIILYAANGSRLNVEQYVTTTAKGFQVNRNELDAGTYFYELIKNGQSVYAGKIIFL